MELNDYQKKAMTTCLPTSNNFSYMMLNLVGEVGEFASKVAKAIRKRMAAIGYFPNSHNETEDNIFATYLTGEEDKQFKDELKKEAGDILWQLSGLCSVMGWTLEEVAQMNLDKLASRKQRNQIDGNGDNR